MAGGVAEGVQALGRDGVQKIKKWLDSTTHVAIEWTVYDNQPVCTLQNLSGKPKRFDLLGKMLKKGSPPVAVEAKRYSSAHSQGKLFQEFIATAYSTSAYELKHFGDSGREYMWVTYHPFAQREWKNLLKRKNIVKALGEHPELLAGEKVDEDLVDALATRVWLLVIHSKQHALILKKKELKQVFSVINRKGA